MSNFYVVGDEKLTKFLAADGSWVEDYNDAEQLSIEEAEEEIKVRTRQYARQQRTWLRRFKAIPGAIWVDGPRVSTSDAARIVIDTLFGGS